MIDNYRSTKGMLSSSPQLELKLFSSTYSDYGSEAKNNSTTTTNLFSAPSLLSTPLSSISYYQGSDNSNPSIYWLHPKNSTNILSDDYNYPLLNDKKTYLEHLSTKQLSLNIIRTAGTQGGLVVAHYYQDLMNYKMENDTLVFDDKLTEEEAEEAVAIWEEREWTKRMNMKSISEKIYQTFLKIQAVTMCMRSYEHVLIHYCSPSIPLIDLLTKDPVAYSRRQAAATIITRYTNDYFSKMFYVCLWGNCISHLSDYTVQQILLVGKYWYDCYYTRDTEDGQDGTSIDKNVAVTDAKTSLYIQSVKIIMFRLIGWVFSSMTAAAGSMIYPKFGTILGVGLGDSLINALSD